MFDPVILAVYALAVARVTGLVALDTITEDLRDSAIDWLTIGCARSERSWLP